MFQSEADRAFLQMMEVEQVEDLLLAAAVDEQPETAEPALPPAVDAALAVTDEHGSYMVADVEYDLERVRVEFTMPIAVATELIGHALNRDDYEEAQFMVNEFVDGVTDVIGRAMFGPPE